MSTNANNINLVAPSPEDLAEARLLAEFPKSAHGQYQLPMDYVWGSMPNWRRKKHLENVGAPEAYMAAFLEWRFDAFRPESQLALYKSVLNEVRLLWELGVPREYTESRTI